MRASAHTSAHLESLAAREQVVHQPDAPVRLRDDARAERGDLAADAPLQVEDGDEEGEARQRRHARHVEPEHEAEDHDHHRRVPCRMHVQAHARSPQKS